MNKLQFNTEQMIAIEQLIDSMLMIKLNKHMENQITNLNRECLKRFKEAETRIQASIKTRIGVLQ